MINLAIDLMVGRMSDFMGNQKRGLMSDVMSDVLRSAG
jgi:hypothetical protein